MRFHPPSVHRRRRSEPALAACLLWASAGLVHAVPGPSQGPAHHRVHAPAHAPAQGSAQVRQIQRAQQALQVLPVPFEANSGQFDAAVAFTGRTFAGAVHVTHQGQIVYSLPGAAPASGTPPDQPTSRPNPRPNPRPTPAPQPAPAAGWSLTETLAGALPLSPRGGEAAATQVTRFSGPHRYHSATYRNLHLGQAWPGVQVELAVRGANVEKLFHVAPQADASQIQVRVDGALSLRLGAGGELLAATGHGDVAYTAPVAFQEVAGHRVDVPVQYALNRRGDGYGFALGAYDRALPLVIDPLLQSTYVGGSDIDVISALAVAPSGAVFVGGYTRSTDFPGTAGGAQPAWGGRFLDAFIARLSGDLRSMEQSTYLGGSSIELVKALAVAPSGEVVAVGYTDSTDFPGAAGGAQPAFGGGSFDGFVARLSGDLRTLAQSTYLGGTDMDQADALAIAPSGEVLVGGYTYSRDLPGTAGGAQPSFGGGGYDGFIARLSGDLRTLEQSTYLGGSGLDGVTALAVTPAAEVVAAGDTGSSDLPGMAGGAQPVFAGGEYDGFIARLSGDLRTLRQGTYLGGSLSDQIQALALAPSGEIVVGGHLASPDLPGAAGGAQPALKRFYDGFIARLSGDLHTLEQSTYLGGSDSESIWALAVTPSGDVVAGGYTYSADFPGTSGGAQPVFGSGSFDGFLTRLSGDLRTLEQSTYIGGSTAGTAILALANTPSGEVVAGGFIDATGLPGTADGAQPDFAGGAYDGFITRLSADLRAVSPQAITFPPQSDQPFTAGARFDLAPPATASSHLPVDYTSATPGVCTVSGTTVTMVSPGTCTLTARQPGNTVWLPAADVSQDMELVAAPAPGPGPGPAPAPGPGAATAVPALPPLALAALGALAAGLGALVLRRRGPPT